MFYTKSKHEGFSLVETLVAISILLLVIVGPMSVTARTAKSSSYATEQVQAFFLAQEGVELVQKVRDDLLLDYFSSAIANPWGRFIDSNGLLQHCYGAGGCGLEWSRTVNGEINSVIQNCTTLSNCLLRLKLDENRSKYTHLTTGINTPTLFTRRIYLTRTGDMVLVRSVVTWRTGSLIAEQQVEVTTYLYNIYATP